MSKNKSFIIVAILSLLAISVAFQNCGDSGVSYSGGGSSVNSSTSFTEEDDIWFRLESARIKIKQLNAIAGFSDNVSREVLEGQTPTGLAGALQSDVDTLTTMMLVDNVSSNSSDVIKKYTSLIDLLSKARDMLLAYYMNIGFDQVARNLQEAKDKLESSIALLESSHQALALAHSRLHTQVDEQDESIRAMRIEMINKMKELEDAMDQKISNLQVNINQTINNLNETLLTRIVQNTTTINQSNTELNDTKALLENALAQLQSTQNQLTNTVADLESTKSDLEAQKANLEALNDGLESTNQQIAALEQQIAETNENLEATNNQLTATQNQVSEFNDKLDNTNSEIAALTDGLSDLAGQLSDLENLIQPQIDYLTGLAEQTRQDLDDFAAAFEELRNAGSSSYSTTLASWSCQEDLIERNGQELLNLSPSISEKCVLSKEETLYAICVERYPTFCGPCAGKTMAQCEHWNNAQVGLTAREKLEILINIRQEVAIENLAQQTEVQRQAIYGTALCKQECLTLENGALKNSCTVEDLNQCGIEGKLMALHLTDQSTIQQITNVSTTINNRITKMDNNFIKAREYSNQRFAELQSYVDSEINRLESVVNARFAQVAQALSGLPFVSSSIKDEVDTLTAEAALAEERAAVAKALVASSLANIPGFSHLSAFEINILLEKDIESVLKVISEGAIGKHGAIGSLSEVMVSLILNVFEKLDADQTNIAEYNARLRDMVAGVCSAEDIAETPYANVVGRDSMEIIALGAARRVVLGDGVGNVNGANTVFADYTKSLVKGSKLQRAFFAAAFDYRKDVTKETSQACLQAIDDFAKEALSSSSLTTQPNGQGSLIAAIFNDQAIMADMLSVYEQTLLVMSKLRSMEESILTRAVIDTESDEFKDALTDIALRLIKAGTSRVVAKLKSAEMESLLIAQRDVADSAFQAQFDIAINTYINEKHKLASVVEEAMGDIVQLQADTIALQENDAAMQEELKNLGAAVGFLQAQHREDQLANEAAFDELREMIADITDGCVEPHQPISTFDPKILAVRHSFEGANQCTTQTLAAMAFPTRQQFVGDRLACNVNFRGFHGYSRWNFGRNKVDKLWFKAWGSATDIEVKARVGNQDQIANVSFQNLPVGVESQQGNHKVMLAAGNVESGSFMMNVSSIFDGIQRNNSSFNQKVYFTPKNTPANKVGPTVMFQAVFYSPLVLSFDQNGHIDTIPVSEGVNFDLMATGTNQKTGWVKGSKGAFLVRDINNNNRIDNGRELFGQATLSKAGKTFDNGFDALAQFDSNGDNKINAKDAIFADLKLWFDMNADGSSQVKELKTLADLDVTEIRLQYADVAETAQNSRGNKVLLSSTFVGPKACGAEGCKIYDIFFNNIEVSTELASNP